MSFAKNKLKLARDALSKKDYAQARDAASQVLEYESDNYNASAPKLSGDLCSRLTQECIPWACFSRVGST